jgi:hypothetical protein
MLGHVICLCGAPVVGWATIRFFMTLAIINNWHKRQLDFVIAFPQADIERELYMRLPAGFSIDGLHLTEEEKKKHVLRLTYMVRNKLVEYGINI